MAHVPVTVECRAGGRADETPVVVVLGDHRREIAEVLDRWLDGGVESGRAVRRIFKVRFADGEAAFLEQDEGTLAWTLRADLRVRMD